MGGSIWAPPQSGRRSAGQIFVPQTSLLEQSTEGKAERRNIARLRASLAPLARLPPSASNSTPTSTSTSANNKLDKRAPSGSIFIIFAHFQPETSGRPGRSACWADSRPDGLIKSSTGRPKRPTGRPTRSLSSPSGPAVCLSVRLSACLGAKKRPKKRPKKCPNKVASLKGGPNNWFLWAANKQRGLETARWKLAPTRQKTIGVSSGPMRARTLVCGLERASAQEAPLPRPSILAARASAKTGRLAQPALRESERASGTNMAPLASLALGGLCAARRGTAWPGREGAAWSHFAPVRRVGVRREGASNAPLASPMNMRLLAIGVCMISCLFADNWPLNKQNSSPNGPHPLWAPSKPSKQTALAELALASGQTFSALEGAPTHGLWLAGGRKSGPPLPTGNWEAQTGAAATGAHADSKGKCWLRRGQ